MNPDQTLDVSGLSCPLPMLRAKKALATLQSGQELEVIATDPAGPGDFEAFCRQTGNVLVQSGTRPDGKFRILLRRK